MRTIPVRDRRHHSAETQKYQDGSPATERHVYWSAKCGTVPRAREGSGGQKMGTGELIVLLINDCVDGRVEYIICIA
jgi:hypothetical protein